MKSISLECLLHFYIVEKKFFLIKWHIYFIGIVNDFEQFTWKLIDLLYS